MNDETPETKVCPDCAETVKARARVCRFCGYRFGMAPPASRAWSAESIFPRPIGGRSWLLLWGLASALLMVFGAVGPWGRVGIVAVGHAGALLVLAAAMIGAALLVVWWERRAAGMAALLSGLFGAAVTLHARRHLARLVRAMHFPASIHLFNPESIHAGWGLNLALLASLSLALCGLVWLIGLREHPRERAHLANAMPPAGER